jgi:hypothetical protein
MDHYILNYGSVILAFTAIRMIKPFKALVDETGKNNVSVMGFQFKETYDAFGNISFLKKLWKKESFEEYESPLRETLISARSRLRFQVIGIMVWLILYLISRSILAL